MCLLNMLQQISIRCSFARSAMETKHKNKHQTHLTIIITINILTNWNLTHLVLHYAKWPNTWYHRDIILTPALPFLFFVCFLTWKWMLLLLLGVFFGGRTTKQHTEPDCYYEYPVDLQFDGNSNYCVINLFFVISSVFSQCLTTEKILKTNWKLYIQRLKFSHTNIKQMWLISLFPFPWKQVAWAIEAYMSYSMHRIETTIIKPFIIHIKWVTSVWRM